MTTADRTTSPRLPLTRSQILAHRWRVQALDERLPRSAVSLRRAAWAGLQDSMPRAALLSIHARVHGTMPSTLEDPSLVHVWGPRFTTYVVAEVDVAPFTLGRMPGDGPARWRAEEIANRLDAFLDGRTMTYGEAGRGLGQHPNSLRYATVTGRVRVQWDGARAPTVWTVPAPPIDAHAARLELARRYLHVLGPATPDSFAEWAGIKPPQGRAAFDGLADVLTPAATPIGDAWILSEDEPAFQAPPSPAAPARLLPSGDTYFLLQGADRELLVSDASQRRLLWTPRVWPGAVLLDGEIGGTWRRAGAVVTVQPWRRLSREQRDAVVAEAESFPLPGVAGPIVVRWED